MPKDLIALFAGPWRPFPDTLSQIWTLTTWSPKVIWKVLPGNASQH